MTGTTEGSTESGFFGEAGNRTCDPWFTRLSDLITWEASNSMGGWYI